MTTITITRMVMITNTTLITTIRTITSAAEAG
jgi:hypothetical protein